MYKNDLFFYLINQEDFKMMAPITNRNEDELYFSLFWQGSSAHMGGEINLVKIFMEHVTKEISAHIPAGEIRQPLKLKIITRENTGNFLSDARSEKANDRIKCSLQTARTIKIKAQVLYPQINTHISILEKDNTVSHPKSYRPEMYSFSIKQQPDFKPNEHYQIHLEQKQNKFEATFILESKTIPELRDIHFPDLLSKFYEFVRTHNTKTQGTAEEILVPLIPEFMKAEQLEDYKEEDYERLLNEAQDEKYTSTLNLSQIYYLFAVATVLETLKKEKYKQRLVQPIVEAVQSQQIELAFQKAEAFTEADIKYFALLLIALGCIKQDCLQEAEKALNKVPNGTEEKDSVVKELYAKQSQLSTKDFAKLRIADSPKEAIQTPSSEKTPTDEKKGEPENNPAQNQQNCVVS